MEINQKGDALMKRFCGHCLRNMYCIYKERIIEFEYDNNNFSFLEKYYVCEECHEEFYDDLHDYNVITANNELRKFYGTILVSEIEEIIEKYNVEAEELSLILGLEKGTISKYLDGRNPKKEHSELLKKIKDDSKLFQLYVDKYNSSNMKV